MFTIFGAIFGGPVGAAMGFLIDAVIGSVVDACEAKQAKEKKVPPPPPKREEPSQICSVPRCGREKLPGWSCCVDHKRG